MSAKAGSRFVCVCCGRSTPEDEAKYDDDLDGAVCKECGKLLMGAQAWLVHVWKFRKPTRDYNNRIK